MSINFIKMKPIDFVLIFGVAGTICTILVVYFTWLHNNLSSKKTSQTLDNTTEILQENKILKEKADAQSNKIDELRNENNKLSAKLMDKSIDIYKNISGDGNKPILIIGSSILNIDPKELIPNYYLLFFTIKNASKLPIRNVIVKITDFTGAEMIKYGVKHVIDGMTTASGVRDKELEYRNFELNKTFDLGTIPPNVKRNVYMTTFPPELIPMPPQYNVEVIWDNGHIIHFVALKNVGEKLAFDHREALFNGVPSNDTSCFKFGED